MTEPLVERLRAAAATVEAAELPLELRPAAFVLAYSEQDLARPSASLHPASSPLPTPSREGDRLGAVADRLGVDVEALESLFDVGEDSVALIAPRRAFASGKLAAMGEVVLLTVAVRQALNLEEWTDTEVVRRQCESMGVLDRNFASVLQRLNGRGVRVRGRGREREIKINAAGYEEAAAIVSRAQDNLG
jgi:hypothetical protein